MNKERLEKLAAHIEKLPREKFDMDQLCGTPCCIAGYVMKITKNSTRGGVLHPAADWLGLSYPGGEGRQLFVPALDRAYRATPKQAAKVIRNLIKTGKVEWEKFV
jgi:hypothetical protein